MAKPGYDFQTSWVPQCERNKEMKEIQRKAVPAPCINEEMKKMKK